MTSPPADPIAWEWVLVAFMWAAIGLHWGGKLALGLVRRFRRGSTELIYGGPLRHSDRGWSDRTHWRAQTRARLLTRADPGTNELWIRIIPVNRGVDMGAFMDDVAGRNTDDARLALAIERLGPEVATGLASLLGETERLSAWTTQQRAALETPRPSPIFSSPLGAALWQSYVSSRGIQVRTTDVSPEEPEATDQHLAQEPDEGPEEEPSTPRRPGVLRRRRRGRRRLDS